MKETIKISIIFVLFASTSIVEGAAGVTNNRILLRDVRAITFRRGAFTAGRRGPPLPQLTCAYSPDHSLDPSTVQCTNVGTDDRGNVQWRCEADLDHSIQFDNLDVSCEGYDSPDDDYILAGSCALTYTLKRVPGYTAANQYQQQQQQQQQQKEYDYVRTKQPYNHPPDLEQSSFLWSAFKVIALFAIVWAIIRCCCGTRRSRHTATPEATPMYPPVGVAAAPPPPGPPPPYPGDYAAGMPPPTAPPASYGYPSPPPAMPPPPAWRPGFWSGFTAGTLFSRWSHPQAPSMTTTTTHVYHHSPAPTSTVGSSGMSSTRTSTGFASTSKR